ncbi:MAG TPA: YihY/virulence factor BrkB family protein [Actinocrinis sp.]|nr:YihY/virulence factor BrkB family protein [Actinocrinis sp.]
MSTATRVPQTRLMAGDELSAEDAWATMRGIGPRTLLRDSFLRFRYADGFSHARALAMQICLSVIPLAIAVVGLSATLHRQDAGQVVQEVLERITPGASRQVMQTALASGQARGQSGGFALWGGLLVALISLTTGMGQIERGSNRIYGVERDRPAVHKYANAAGLALLAGIPMALGMAMVVAGGPFGDALSDVYHWPHGAHSAWDVAHWPVGVLLALLSASMIFKRAPRRRQPGASWLAFGAGVALLLWSVFTGLLAWYVEGSSAFGSVYGPLSGVMALLVWANLSAIALFLGVALAAQLEARRGAVRDPVRPDPGA